MYMKTNSDVVWVLVIYLLLIKSELYRVSLEYIFFMTKEINENKSTQTKLFRIKVNYCLQCKFYRITQL